MKKEVCDRCGKSELLDSTATYDWTDVEYKGRQSTVLHIRSTSFCPSCTKQLKVYMAVFLNNPE